MSDVEAALRQARNLITRVTENGSAMDVISNDMRYYLDDTQQSLYSALHDFLELPVVADLDA